MTSCGKRAVLRGIKSENTGAFCSENMIDRGDPLCMRSCRSPSVHVDQPFCFRFRLPWPSVIPCFSFSKFIPPPTVQSSFQSRRQRCRGRDELYVDDPIRCARISRQASNYMRILCTDLSGISESGHQHSRRPRELYSMDGT